MCKIMEELIAEEKTEWNNEIVLKMKKSGKLSNEEIEECANLTVKEVEEIIEQAKNTV